jgi:hypothetical protein
MKYKKVKLSALLFFGFGLIGLHAQNQLYVKEKTGTQTPITLSNIKKLTFATGNMIVNKSDGNASTFSLSNIQYLIFNDNTTNVSQLSLQESSKMILYPNPVIDQLQISYEAIMEGVVHLEIIDLQGKVLYQQIISCQTGINHAIIPISQLTNGLYMCSLKNGNKIQTLKFFKN